MTKILVIEDELEVRENILETLKAEKFDVTEAENGFAGTRLAIALQPDLIICDVMMPQLDGYGVLRVLRQNENTATIPFIFLTAKSEKADWRRGMELGADDYLIKPFSTKELLAAIAARLQGRVALEKKHAKELKELENKYSNLLYYDSLTKLPNRLSLRSLFEEARAKLSLETQHSASNTGSSTDNLSAKGETLLEGKGFAPIAKPEAPTKKMLPVLCLGLDRLSRINETLGYSFGDLLLKAVAKRLTNFLEPGHVVARLNSDQFAIVPGAIAQRNEASKIAENLLAAIAKPFLLEGKEVFVTASTGMAVYPQDGQRIDQLLQKANKAMRRVKESGGNNYQFYIAVWHRASDEILALENGLRYALDADEFELYYQPQVDLQTGQIVGAEALLRWQHPQLGLVSPAKFIPLAEESGLIVPIGEWVLKTACQQSKAWQAAGFPSLRMAVNLSGRQFALPNLRQRLVQILMEASFNPEYLDLELTESIVIQDPKAASGILQLLKTLGVKIAIDDFGTGYSSLSYLQQFPFDLLKIDRCFIKNISKNPTNQALTKSIIEMAHSLNLQAIAEGVETEAEMGLLRQYKCDLMQGYLFSKPLPALKFEQLLR
ncbi:MAG: EAL domain-containing protein [Oscillatoria sp. SIO1A7]|nr:EAL domain-containing protein [Oscillatoria sp. SIO1A7]